MKKAIVFFCAFLFTTALVSAQKLDSATLAAPQKRYDYYWQAYKHKVRTGRSLLVTGLTATAIGAGIIAIGIGSDTDNDHGTVAGVVGLGLSTVGVGALITSIPFFISAGNDKRKAKLALKGEALTMGNQLLLKTTYPALAVRIPL